MVPILSFLLESVFRVPETTFNNMHGKIDHVKTEDADQYLNNRPNALGNIFFLVFVNKIFLGSDN